MLDIWWIHPKIGYSISCFMLPQLDINVYIYVRVYIYPPYFQSLAWKQSYLPFGDCFLQASVPSSGQHTTVGESLAHTKLPHLYTQPWGWGGAREEKCRIYQPHPLLNFITSIIIVIIIIIITIIIIIISVHN